MYKYNKILLPVLLVMYMVVILFLLWEVMITPVILYTGSTTYLGKWNIDIYSGGKKCRVKILIVKNEGSAMDYSNIRVYFKPRRCMIKISMCSDDISNTQEVHIRDLSILFKDYLFLAGLKYDDVAYNDLIQLDLYLTDVFMDIDTFCVKINKIK